MCRVLVPCADFKAILMPFSEVIQNRRHATLGRCMPTDCVSWNA